MQNVINVGSLYYFVSSSQQLYVRRRFVQCKIRNVFAKLNDLTKFYILPLLEIEIYEETTFNIRFMNKCWWNESDTLRTSYRGRSPPLWIFRAYCNRPLLHNFQTKDQHKVAPRHLPDKSEANFHIAVCFKLKYTFKSSGEKMHKIIVCQG